MFGEDFCINSGNFLEPLVLAKGGMCAAWWGEKTDKCITNNQSVDYFVT